MPRLAAIAAALLIALLGAWFALSRFAATAPPPAATAADTRGAADGGAAQADDGLPGANAADRRSDAGQPPAPLPSFTVTGIVLGEPAAADLSAVRVLAWPGEPGERGGVLPMMSAAGGARAAIAPTGEPLAEARADAKGTFTLRATTPHLRLTIDHDLYTLPLPEVVHVPPAAGAAHVVLTPLLGGMLRGRLLGERRAEAEAVRLMLEADPMSAMRDSRAFLSAMMSGMQRSAMPTADGMFVFRGVTAGAAITLTVEGDTVCARTAEPALAAGEIRDVVVPVRAGASLDVEVVDRAGAAVAGATVSARSATPASALLGQLLARRGQTGADGICRLHGLPTERTTIEASAPARLTASTAIDVQAGDTPQRVRLELGTGGTVTGIVVTPDGTPLADARVAHCPAERIPLLGDLASHLGAEQLAAMANGGVRTDADGRFVLTGLADAGAFLVVAAHPDWAAGHSKEVRMGDQGVQVAVQPLGGLRGRVVAEADDRPLDTFTVTLLRTSFLVLRTPVRQETFRDAADGAFELGKIPPGDYTLQVTAEGCSDRETTIAIAAATADAGTIELARGAAIVGFVRDEQGRPVRGALVRRRQGGMGDNPMLAMFGGGGAQSAYSDHEGRFRLEPLAAGRLQLLASATGFASGRSERLHLQAGEVLEGVVIGLGHGGAIRGCLLAGQGQRADEFLLTVQEMTTQSAQTGSATADGTFLFENLDPGQYTVQAMPVSLMQGLGNADWRPGQSMRFGEMFQKITDHVVSQRCAVRAGETTEVALDATEITTGTRWTVRVEVGGAALTDGLIEATAAEDGRMRVAMLIDGAAAFTGIRPGPHRLQVRSGMTMAAVGQPQDAVFPASAASHRTTLSLPGGELRGRVVDAATDRPIRAALVRLLHDGHSERDDPLGMSLSDGEGAFRFAGLADGSYSLIVVEVMGGQGDATASRRDGIRVTAGHGTDPIELRATPAATASVLVTTENGAPIAGATVLCVDAEGRPLGAMGLATSGPDGRATFGGMPRGRGRVVGRAPGRAPAASDLLDLAPDTTAEFVLPLPPGARTMLQVVDRAGETVAGATLTARCNGGPWLPTLLLVEGLRSDGAFDLGPLGRGAWEFRVSHASLGTVSQTRTIGAESSLTVVIAPR